VRSTLELASIILAFVAAGLWLWSASVRLPKGQIWFGAPLGGGAPNDDVDQLVNGLRLQSRLSAAVAIAAGLSAACQGVARFV
jgi:hypothetical protein